MRKSKKIHLGPRVRRGFSLLELVIVVAISLCLAAIAVPTMVTVIANSRMHGAMGDLSGVAQSCRTLAVKKNMTHWIQVKAVSGRLVAFVKPSSASADDPIAPSDPQVWLPTQMQKYSTPSGDGAPTALTADIMWGGGLDPETTKDTYFNARGLPCDMGAGGCSPGPGFLYYFSYTRSIGTPLWAALGTSPAGRIRVWYWNGSSWGS